MNKEEVEKIKDFVKCPQLGSLDYGKWGALNLEQRKKINELCDSWLIINEHDIKNNKIIEEAIESCKSVIGNKEHTIVSKNKLMKLQLEILEGAINER